MASIPSIAMIPSGYKATKIYSVLPVDGGADLTFSRPGVGDAGVANRVASNGLIEEMATDVPRLDYSDGGCPSLLLEPQSTNLITYSEEFDNVAWSKSNITITANQAISPKGDLTADLWTATGASFPQLVESVSGLTIGNDYTISIYVKADAGTQVEQRFFVSGFAGVNFTPTNDWQRITYTFKATSTTHTIVLATDSSSSTLTSYYIWGAQLEEQSYATSYIPTSGALGTRIAETCSKSGLGSYINSSEGVLYAEMSALANDGTTRAISVDNGSSSVGATIRFRPTANEFQFLLKDGVNPDVGNTLILSDATQTNKFALKWKSGDIALWVNGVEELTASGTMNISGLTDLSFSTFGSFYGKVKDLRVYKSALTDAELQTLTTL